MLYKYLYRIMRMWVCFDGSHSISVFWTRDLNINVLYYIVLYFV